MEIFLQYDLRNIFKIFIDRKKCDALQQKVPYGPCYKLLVWY